MNRPLALAATISCLMPSPAVADLDPNPREWNIERTTDPMDDTRQMGAWVEAQEPIEGLAGVTETALLAVACAARDLEVAIVLSAPLKIRVERRFKVRIRLDKEKPLSWEVVAAGQPGTLAFLGSGRLIERMVSARSMLVEIETISRREVCEFDLRDLRTTVGKIREECR